MKISAKRLLRREGGQTLVLAALSMVVLLGFSALAVDVGMWRSSRTKMQNVADAAALAGARDLPSSAAAQASAQSCAALNGVSGAGIVVTTPYNGDPSKIEVVCLKTEQSVLARVLGFGEVDVGGRAVAQKSGMGGGPFGYAVFSGNPNFTLTINGSNTTLGGSAHSNDDFSINGSAQLITGSAEAVSELSMNGSNLTVSKACQGAKIKLNGSGISIGSKIYEAASWIDMPDFSDEIQAAAQAAGTAYVGNQTFNGSSISVDTPIYVAGNLVVNGSGFSGKGVVLVTGDITFNGSNLSQTGSSVCFYSKNGDITINGSGIRLDGLVYAPNGDISMNGSNQTINGRVIGDKVLFNGSGISILSGSGDLDCLPASEVKLIE